MFIKLSSLLPSTINRTGMKKTFDAAIVCAQYTKIAKEIVHLDVLEHTTAYIYRDSVLTIGVINPAWGQKVMESAEKLRETINKHLHGEVVKTIKIKVTDKIHEDF